MVPLIEVSEDVLKTFNPRDYTRRADLETILKKDKKGKPILNLIPSEKTAVHIPTQENYNELMRIYECGGWRWHIGFNFWEVHKKETCVSAGISYNNPKGEFEYWGKRFYLRENWKIISPQEFYEKQKITPKMLNEINKYFEGRK